MQTVSRIFLKEALSPKLLLVDGLSRSGKMLIAKLVSPLQAVEYFQVAAAVDHIPIVWRLGQLDDDAAGAFLRLQLDYAIYDRVTGRNLNLRYDDSSSILKAPDYPRYAKRPLEPESPELYQRFNEEGRFPFFFTHEILPHIRLFFRVTDDLRVIEVERHPVDLVISWLRRGWGERWGVDPLALIPTAEHAGRPVPWFAVEWADDYLDMRPIDRVISGILTLDDLCRKTLDGLSAEQRRCIHLVAYDMIVTRPRETVEGISAFLETQPFDTLPALITRERLPGPPPSLERQKKLDVIQDTENADPGLATRLIEAGRDYEARWALEPLAP